MFSVLMQIRLFDKISREKSENQNGARSIWFMSSERIFAQDFNSTRIIALSYLFPEIGPKIKIRSLSLPFPLNIRVRRHFVQNVGERFIIQALFNTKMLHDFSNHMTILVTE